MEGGWRLLIFVFFFRCWFGCWCWTKHQFVSKILTDILFYVQDIPQSTRTISGNNHIKWCQWEHLLDRILKGLRVRGAGLKLFRVSIENLTCHLCIGCSLPLINKGTTLCVITYIFGTSYSFRLVHSNSGIHYMYVFNATTVTWLLYFAYFYSNSNQQKKPQSNHVVPFKSNSNRSKHSKGKVLLCFSPQNSDSYYSVIGNLGADRFVLISPCANPSNS